MSPSLTIPTAFFFYLDNLLVTVSGSYSSSCLLFRPIFWPLIFWTCPVASTQSPCLLEPVPIQPSLTWSYWGTFSDTHSAPLLQFSGFLKFSSELKTTWEAFHINSYFSQSSLAGMYTPRHSVLKGRGNFHLLFSRDWKPRLFFWKTIVCKKCAR